MMSTPLHPDVWITGEQAVYYLHGGASYKVKGVRIPDPVSLFRLTSGRSYGKVKSKGLLWESDVFRREGYLSLSNRINPSYADKGFELECEGGDFLLVVPSYAIVGYRG